VRNAARSVSGHLPKQLGGSTPAARTPHRGARFAFDAMVTIGRQKPGSIRPPRQSCQEGQQDLLRAGNALLSANHQAAIARLGASESRQLWLPLAAPLPN
jgi:hypothetical protein